MYIKIYFGDKPVFLCDAITPDIEPFLHHDDAVFIEEFSSSAIKSMIYEMGLPGIKAGVLLHHHLTELKQAFFKKFVPVTAGGGAVWNNKKQLLFIHRRGKWDLPKGKLDAGETIEHCAVREVEEETGLKNPTITSPLLITYHTYHENGKHLLKTSHWFVMQVNGEQQTLPQSSEDIIAIEWLAKDQWHKIITETFPSILDVLATLASSE
jgi:8-oxo-dGTP pyrophosphatase MutT (NUDIX family)